ncbi:MAG: hypothetical protein ACLQVG_10920 [Terriglobia bacterium]
MRIAAPTNEKGQISSHVLKKLTLELMVLIFFAFLNSAYSQLPLSTGAPYEGQKAPGFNLPDQNGGQVTLADLLKPAAGGKKCGGLVLIFYRGYW